jgi:hypothetical protein
MDRSRHVILWCHGDDLTLDGVDQKPISHKPVGNGERRIAVCDKRIGCDPEIQQERVVDDKHGVSVEVEPPRSSIVCAHPAVQQTVIGLHTNLTGDGKNHQGTEQRESAKSTHIDPPGHSTPICGLVGGITVHLFQFRG